MYSSTGVAGKESDAEVISPCNNARYGHNWTGLPLILIFFNGFRNCDGSHTRSERRVEGKGKDNETKRTRFCKPLIRVE